MKNLLIFCLLTISSLISATAETPTHLVVWGADGSKVTYLLSDEPDITFEESEMLISANDVEIKYAINTVQQLTYETGAESSIDTPAKDSATYTMYGDILKVTNPTSNFSVAIYDIDGQSHFHGEYNKYEEATISIHNLNSGIYILQINNNSYKLYIK